MYFYVFFIDVVFKLIDLLLIENIVVKRVLVFKIVFK